MNAAILIATRETWLSDALLRLAAAADAEAAVVQSGELARLPWRQARVVLVGADLAGELAVIGLPRRPSVVLVGDASGQAFVDPYRQAIEVGAQDVAVLPEHEPWLIDLMAGAAEPWAGKAAVLCVIGGRGGAGASTFAAMLGLIAVRRRSQGLLLDGDPLGGGVDLVLAREQVAGARWPEFVGLRGRLNSTTLHESLPRVSGPGRSSCELAVLSWHRDETGAVPQPVPAPAMRSVLESAVRGFDLVVVDLPRQVDEATAEALRAADATVLVVPLEVRAAAAAGRVAAAVRPHTSDLRLVVRGPSPGGLTAQDLAAAIDLPLAGEFASDRRLALALENGELPAASRRRGPLPALCARLLTEFAVEPSERAA